MNTLLKIRDESVRSHDLRFRFPNNLKPTSAALDKRTRQLTSDALAAFREGAPPRDQAAARQLYFGFQALYVVLRACEHDTVELRKGFALVSERLRAEVKDAYRDISRYRSEQHQSEIFSLAEDICRQISEADKEPAPASESAGSMLNASEVKEMKEAFTQVVLGDEREERSIYLERSFAHEMIQDWDRPLLTTTAHAVETLHMLARHEWELAHAMTALGSAPDNRKQRPAAPDFRVDPAVLEFVTSCYRQREALFAACPDGPGDLYATSSAIAIYKAARDLACNESATAEQLGELLPPSIDFLAIREAALAKLGKVLRESAPASSSQHGNAIVEINHAIRILWNLRGSEEVPALIAGDRQQLRDFLAKCVVLKDIALASGEVIKQQHTCVMAPGSPAACLTACLAAARIVQHAKLNDEVLERDIKRCGPYVKACMQLGSGFGSSVRHEADLLHTYMGLSLSRYRDWRFEDEYPGFEEGILRFVQRCYQGGGYALLPDWKPSAYGTRLALQILLELEQPIANRFEMARFIRRLLRENAPSGTAFVGHLERSFNPHLS